MIFFPGVHDPTRRKITTGPLLEAISCVAGPRHQAKFAEEERSVEDPRARLAFLTRLGLASFFLLPFFLRFFKKPPPTLRETTRMLFKQHPPTNMAPDMAICLILLF